MAKKINIDKELEVIQKGKYGEDVRYAIHDALEKINQNGGGGGGDGTALVGPGIYYTRGVEALIGNNGGIVTGAYFEISIFDVLNVWDNSSGQYGNIAGFKFYDANHVEMPLPPGTIVTSTTTDVEGHGVANVIDDDNSTYWQWSHTSGPYNPELPVATDKVRISFMFGDFMPKYISYITANCINWDAWSPSILRVRYVNDIGQQVFDSQIIDCTGDVPYPPDRETPLCELNYH